MAVISLWKAPGKQSDVKPQPVSPVRKPLQKPVPSKEKPKVVTVAKPAPSAAVAATKNAPKQKPAKKEKPVKRKKRATSAKEQPVPVSPPKKRGRPSKEEVAVRAQERLENERARKEQLIAIQHSILGTSDEEQTEPTQTQEESGFVPNYPIYQVGDDVELVNPSLVPGEGKRRGRVTRHDINSAWVHVRWDDKCTDWRHATVIQKLPDLRVKPGGKKRGRPKKGG